MRRSHRRKNRQKKIIIISAVCLVCLMTAGYAAFNTQLSVNVKGNIVDKSRIIKSWTDTSNEDFHTDFYRENIVSATFLDTNEVPSNAVKSWDVSADNKKGVMAYVTETSTEAGKYDLFIGAKNGVIANEDSSWLFYKFSNIKTIDFQNNFDTRDTVNMSYMFGTIYEKTMAITSINFGEKFITKNVTDMSYMFFNNNKLTALDVSKFETSNVTTFSGIFHGCESLTSLDVSNFDMRKVVSISNMFNGCRSLTSLDVSKWDTSNIKFFGDSFANLNNIRELNLCSFDTRNATDMARMFSWSNKLTKIKVGSNWTTTNANTTDMFRSSGVSSVTTGECPV